MVMEHLTIWWSVSDTTWQVISHGSVIARWPTSSDPNPTRVRGLRLLLLLREIDGSGRWQWRPVSQRGWGGDHCRRGRRERRPRARRPWRATISSAFSGGLRHHFNGRRLSRMFVRFDPIGLPAHTWSDSSGSVSVGESPRDEKG